MWKPDEKLDDYVVTPDAKVAPEPPPAQSLRRSGEVEILKPLTRPAVHARTTFKTFRRTVSPQPLWFRRFIAVGSGALVMIALVLVSAILVGINDSAAGPEVATNPTSNEMLTQPEEPFNFELPSPPTLAPAADIARSNTIKRRPFRPKVHLTANKPRPQLRPIPQPEQPEFVPTTLVIYAEDGVIKSRIEPWFRSS